MMTHDTVHTDAADCSSQCPDSTGVSQYNVMDTLPQDPDTADMLPLITMTLLTCLIA